ncbi:MAG: thioesterase family protein [Solirubrobacterales bacterium]
MSGQPDAFYEPDGDGFRATVATRGPWDAGSQHAGPPCALLGRQLERCDARPDSRVSRITFDILRPIPIGKVSVDAEVVRDGRSVELVHGTLSDDDGVIMRAAAWRIRTTELELPDVVGDGGAVTRPGPEAGEPHDFFPTGQDVGYHTSMDYRFTAGNFLEPGPARCWLRMRVQLIGGQQPTPLERALVAADTGNGISSALDYREWVFINTDLAVHLHRLPGGEWVGLDSVTRVDGDGIGLTETALYDERGELGRAAQSLLVAPRSD